MNSTAQPHWADIGESTSVAGVRFLCGVYRWLGRWPFRVCLYPVVLVHWLSNRTARRASLQYLQRLHQHAPGTFARQPGALTSLRHFGHFAETLLDKILAMGGRYPADRVTTLRDGVMRRVQQGQGGLIITAHIGCLELCQVLADSVPGFRLTALVHTAHAERFNRMLERLDPANGVRLMQVTEIGPATASLLAERVAAGEFVAIAGDRVPLHGGRSVRVPFLGHAAPFPIGAYALASVLGCPVFTMACTHAGDGYIVRFEEFAESLRLPRGSRDAALAEHAARFAQWLEGQAVRAPLDWFNFFPFWDQVPHDTSPQ
ncbi:MAG TPA: acyltransferase [Pseudoxanthomonas sp.]|nr:acyltransferase [Pseudoxanthomonas sp.]